MQIPEFYRANPAYLKQAARNYCFQYYLRKGIRLDPALLVKAVEEEEQQRLPPIVDNYPFDINDVVRYIAQEYLKNVPDASRWEDVHFVKHFYLGNGRGVTLDEIGHLNEVMQAAEGIMYERLKQQVADAAAKSESGRFEYAFQNRYDFDVEFSYGESKLDGLYEGEVFWMGRGLRGYRGIAKISFSDAFVDPVDRIQVRRWFNATTVDINKWAKELTGFDLSLEITDEMIRNAEMGGMSYPITGAWEWGVAGEV